MSIKNKKFANSDHSLAHVLYQKLGKDWYAFAEVDGECFMAKADDDFIQSRIQLDPESISQIPAELRKKLVA
jgi:hypothetical protein